MRCDIIHEASEHMTYEIREIVEVANHLKSLSVEITWENIGDPIEKGEKMPEWIKLIIKDLVMADKPYGYVASKGVPETRAFLAEEVNRRGGCQITAEDILFYNGLGDAVAKIYGNLKREARVIGPAPTYSTHSSAEAAHAVSGHITYERDPRNGWMPDLDDLENKIKRNKSIAGMLIINPDNPTGTVYPESLLKGMVSIAEKYDLFIVCDEIYANILYNGAETARLSRVIGGVPGIAMRGISKEYPWPGSRCGWLEVFNKDKHPIFKRYIKCLINAKMLEVCSTSLPQYSIPLVMGDARYAGHLEARKTIFEKRTNEAFDFFSKTEGVYVNRPQGAFYMAVLFEPGLLTDKQSLPVRNEQARAYIEGLLAGVAPDKRFVYYLLASTGICAVPLTGFSCRHPGFRITMLECNDEKRLWTWRTIADSIRNYIKS